MQGIKIGWQRVLLFLFGSACCISFQLQAAIAGDAVIGERIKNIAVRHKTVYKILNIHHFISLFLHSLCTQLRLLKYYPCILLSFAC